MARKHKATGLAAFHLLHHRARTVLLSPFPAATTTIPVVFVGADNPVRFGPLQVLTGRAAMLRA